MGDEGTITVTCPGPAGPDGRCTQCGDAVMNSAGAHTREMALITPAFQAEIEQRAQGSAWQVRALAAEAEVEVLRAKADLRERIVRGEIELGLKARVAGLTAKLEAAEEMIDTLRGDCGDDGHAPWCREWPKMVAERDAARAEVADLKAKLEATEVACEDEEAGALDSVRLIQHLRGEVARLQAAHTRLAALGSEVAALHVALGKTRAGEPR